MLSTSSKLFVIVLMFLSHSLTAQISNDTIVKKSRATRTNVTELYFQNSSPFGNNFAGNGLNGAFGFGVRSQWYVYKGFYIGGALSNDYLTVSDQNIVGRYDRLTRKNAYLYLGYDYSFNDNWHLTSDLGIGSSRNKNKVGRTQGIFIDSGTLYKLTTSIEYEFSPLFSVFASPSIELVDYKIETAPSLDDRFNSASYFNFSVGVRFTTRALGEELAGLSKLERDIVRIERIPDEQRNGQQRIRLKYLKKRLARRKARKD